MAAKTTAPTKRPVPRIYLATRPLGDGADAGDRLTGLLDAADIAAVLLRLMPADDRSLIRHIKTLAPVIQQRGIALLLDGHFDIVARAGADGAHVSGIEAVNDALSALKPDRIVGAGGLASRHDSMIAAEAGADYVLFGEPDQGGHRPKLEAIVERLSWWAEVFEPPCVAYAADLAEVGALAATGADFILLDEFVWRDPRGPRQALTDASQAIATAMTSPVAENQA
jgi:thiamine-phosphate pyrophosphorylase